MTRGLRVALIGAGGVASRHLSVLARFESVELVAICDVLMPRAIRAAEKFRARSYADWREMLISEDLDAVVVCTPPTDHAEPTSQALLAGIHVYVEKPLARSLADGRAILEAYEASTAVCAVGYQWRALDLLDQVRESLRGTSIGLLVSRSVGPAEHGRLSTAAAARRPPWFLDPRASGGALFEIASHDIDLQMALAGDVGAAWAVEGSVALAHAGLPALGMRDALALVLEFTSGGLGTISLGWTDTGLAEYYALDILAPTATLVLDLDPIFVLRGSAGGRTFNQQSCVAPVERSIGRFVEASVSGQRDHVFCTPRDAFDTLCVALACERAIAERAVATPPRRS